MLQILYNYNIRTLISTNNNDILKTKGKLKNMRDDIVDEYVTHKTSAVVVKVYHFKYFPIISHINYCLFT